MEQTFNDLLRERAAKGKGLFCCVLWIFAETTLGILKENLSFLIMRNRNIARIALVTASILLVPLIAMQFTDEVNWTLSDFVIAGALLFGTGLAFDLLVRKARVFAYRAGVGVALAAALLLVWLNLAVGLIGSENNPANLMYAGVLAVGIIGAGIARFEARRMARALFAAAIAQGLVGAIALVAQLDPRPAAIVMLNGFFVGMWVVSGLLFQSADQKQEVIG